ncbi:MAG TPA: hypothetical protein VFN31_03690 [Candidatus Saccharimonadales bacterium]|nr:hypothetical protein [Candidatus Saccharimonadales bacterium]
MFGHQDQADNNGSGAGPSQHQPTDDIDMNIQDLNDMDNQPYNAPPAQDPTQPQPYVNQPQQQDNDQAITLQDQNSDQAVDLVDLKTKALDELYPIIHKLDLSAEDNFKTLMMMIQATDNKDLIGQAYEAAERIEDESARAKALLDIVNEINYFTNHPSIDQ